MGESSSIQNLQPKTKYVIWIPFLILLGLGRTFHHLIGSISHISKHLMFLLIVVLVYALIGVFFFKGKLEYRCRTTPYPINGTWALDPSVPTLCGEVQCPTGSYCGNPAEYNIIRNESEYNQDSDLYYGVFNFDSIAHSLLTSLIFLSITGWSAINDIVKIAFIFF